jgi:hypothetical protein
METTDRSHLEYERALALVKTRTLVSAMQARAVCSLLDKLAQHWHLPSRQAALDCGVHTHTTWGAERGSSGVETQTGSWYECCLVRGCSR